MDASRVCPLTDATAGMVLAMDVLDTRGGLVLGKESILTEAMLLSLQRRGIDTIQVVAENEKNVEQEVEMVRQRLMQLFRRCNDNPSNHLLRQYVTQYRLKGDHD